MCVCIHTSLLPSPLAAFIRCSSAGGTDGDTSPKALVISIHDDNTFEPTEADDKPTEAESEALLEWWPTEAKKKSKMWIEPNKILTIFETQIFQDLI